jgi:hypothetical protein
MNFNSTSILTLEQDNLANNRAFTKVINNLPLYSSKKRKIVSGKAISRVLPINSITYRVVNSRYYSNGRLVGMVLTYLNWVKSSFKNAITLLFTYQPLPKISSGNLINRRQQAKCFHWNSKEGI